MFYVIYPELWKLFIKNENFVIVEQGGGGPFGVSGGPFAVLEILEKNSRFWNFFSEFLNFLKTLKIMSYNFQSRKQILMLRGVYQTEIFEMHFHFLLHIRVRVDSRPISQQIYKELSTSIRRRQDVMNEYVKDQLNVASKNLASFFMRKLVNNIWKIFAP